MGCRNSNYQLATGRVDKQQYVSEKLQDEEQAVSRGLYLDFIIMAENAKLQLIAAAYI